MFVSSYKLVLGKLRVHVAGIVSAGLALILAAIAVVLFIICHKIFHPFQLAA